MKKENKIYIYTDENGNPLYKQERYYKGEDKSFYSEKFIDGKWIKGLSGVRRVLYKLPMIIEGIKKAQKVYFVEGEKDVETLIEKGKIATTIAGGANQKWQDSFTDTLKNADVVIIPDNDKAGQEFATRVADSLVGNANTVKLLDLTKKWKELKEKGDITDVFEMVQNDEEVLKQLEELEQETPFYMKKIVKEKGEETPKEIKVEELDILLKIPQDFWCSKEDGVGTYIRKDGKKIKILPILILIKTILKDIDIGAEKIELVFLRRKKWESIIVDKNIISNKNNIINLANKGIPVTTQNARDLVNWFYNLEVANYDDIKIEKTINRMGWINNNTFIPYANNEVHLSAEPGIMTWLEKYKESKGNIDNWITNIKEFLLDDESQIIRFLIATRI